MTFSKDQDGTRKDKTSFPQNDVSKTQIRAKTLFSKIGTKVSQESPDTSPPTQTVPHEFMVQRDGTVLPLHQMLLRVSIKSDLRRQLVKSMKFRRPKCLKIVCHFVPRIDQSLPYFGDRKNILLDSNNSKIIDLEPMTRV